MDSALAYMKLRWIGMLVSFALAGTAASGNPVSIAVDNAGFEANPISEGCFAVFNVDSWDVYDPNGIMASSGNVVGGLNIPPGSVFFPGGAPQGDHAAIVFLSGTIGAGPAGLTQVLADALQAETTYTLRVQVGNIASGTGPPPCDVFGFFDLDGFPGYRVQLLAGGEVIAEDDNSLAGVIDDGEFGFSVTEVSIGSDHAQLGELLEIRLINRNQAQTEDHPGIEVDFDDVQLVARPNSMVFAADFDIDCDVDLNDYDQFNQCFAGPNQPPQETCPPSTDADLDHDGDVDLMDFCLLSASFTGEL